MSGPDSVETARSGGLHRRAVHAMDRCVLGGRHAPRRLLLSALPSRVPAGNAGMDKNATSAQRQRPADSVRHAPVRPGEHRRIAVAGRSSRRLDSGPPAPQINARTITCSRSSSSRRPSFSPASAPSSQPRGRNWLCWGSDTPSSLALRFGSRPSRSRFLCERMRWGQHGPRIPDAAQPDRAPTSSGAGNGARRLTDSSRSPRSSISRDPLET